MDLHELGVTESNGYKSGLPKVFIKGLPRRKQPFNAEVAKTQ
jgi:hypothetical protein